MDENEHNIPPAAEPMPEPVVESEQTGAMARLRAFEDANLGEDAVRIHDKIERGHGSPFAAMSPEKKAQYAALEKLVEAEQKLADATAVAAQAESDRVAAEENLQKAEAAAEPEPDADGK